MRLPNRPPFDRAFPDPFGRAFALLATLALVCAFLPSLRAQTKVMTNGDSITFGIGASNTDTQSYSAELARLLGSAYYVQKDGTGGATMLKKGQPSFWNTQGIRITTEMNPAIIYIMLGTNDSKSVNWVYRDEYIPDYLSLIDLYRALPARPQIYVGLPPPATASNGDVDGPTVANQVIPRILEVARQRDVRVVDVHTPFLDPFRSLLPDGIHPNDEGHRVIARAIRDAILYGRYWRALPAAWQRNDVGATGFAGADAIDESSIFQVLGGGAGIGGLVDAFRFVNQSASGDVEVTARVLGQRNVDPLQPTRADSAAGVMIREGTAAGARHFSVIATPGGDLSLRWRDAVGMSGGSTVVTGVSAPVWVRVRRVGNTFAGFYSANGLSWTQIGASRQLAMSSSTLAGLVANSAQGDTLTHARFDQVAVSGAVSTTPSTPPPTTEPPPTTTIPPPTTTPEVSTVTANFDPSASAGRTLVNDAYASIFDPARTNWSFASGDAAIRPTRVPFGGTGRDSLGFDGKRMLPGPRAQDLFAPGITQDLGIAAVVSIPASGGSGQALILSINKTDTEPAMGLGYDYGLGRFYAIFSQAANGAASEISGAGSPRGASYVVRVQKTGANVRLFVDGKLLAETNSARSAVLALGQGAPIGLGGLRPLNPQFVGQVGGFYLRNGAFADTEIATLESALRTWVGGEASIPTSGGGATTPPASSTPSTDVSSAGATAAFDPASSTGRALVGDAFASIFDPARGAWAFATDQSALRPTRVTLAGTTRDALSFDGARMLPGPRSQDLFTPGLSQDLGLVAMLRIPATGGSGKAIVFGVNGSDTQPALALGYDYGQSRFYAVFTQAFNGAPSEIAGAASPRGASYAVRLQKTGGLVRLWVDGKLLAETTTARGAILASGQSGRLALGGIRELNPQFVGQVGKFHLRNAALSDADALALENDVRAWAGATTTSTTPPPTTSTPTSPSTDTPSTGLAAGFDPAAAAARALVNDAYASISDPTRAGWSFATEQAALRPLRAVLSGTTRDALSFDGLRMLPGPRSQDLFAPGASQDAGLVALVRVPAGGGSGKALILGVNKSDTEQALALGYDYAMGRFYVVYTQAFNGAPSELAGAASAAPRGASYVVRVQKAGGSVRLWVDGRLVAETNSARPAVLANGEGGRLALGGIRELNPQFVGQLGKFHLRNAALSDAEAMTLEADLRAWMTGL